jgi:hypothetical protein
MSTSIVPRVVPHSFLELPEGIVRIRDRRNGSIAFRSEHGAGTAFTIRLPVEPSTVEPQDDSLPWKTGPRPAPSA